MYCQVHLLKHSGRQSWSNVVLDTIGQVYFQEMLIKRVVRYYWSSVLPGIIGLVYCKVILFKCSERYHWVIVIPGTNTQANSNGYCQALLGKLTVRYYLASLLLTTIGKVCYQILLGERITSITSRQVYNQVLLGK